MNEFENGILQQFMKESSRVFKHYRRNNKNIYVSLPISSSNPSCLQCHTNIYAPKEMDKYHEIPKFDDKGGEITCFHLKSL